MLEDLWVLTSMWLLNSSPSELKPLLKPTKYGIYMLWDGLIPSICHSPVPILAQRLWNPLYPGQLPWQLIYRLSDADPSYIWISIYNVTELLKVELWCLEQTISSKGFSFLFLLFLNAIEVTGMGFTAKYTIDKKLELVRWALFRTGIHILIFFLLNQYIKHV